VADTLQRPEVAEDPRRAGRSARRRPPLLFAALGTAIAASLAVVLFVGVGTRSGPNDVAPGINGPSAYLLRLDVLGAGGAPAPNFTLNDQAGRAVSLAQFRGKSVVLSFNDDRCTDICTLLAQDVVAADRDLGPAARDVVFLSVNANPYYPGVGAVRAWTDEHGLGRVANWVFSTGSPAALRAVWKRYGVEVEQFAATRTVVHSTELYFIGSSGRQLAIGSFGTAAADTAVFAHALAQMADDDLPPSEQVQVAGPSALAANEDSGAIGARVPSFSLPVLGHGRRSLDSSALAGRYSVLDFWSSTCTACFREMPALEQAYKDLGSRVNFVGVDVADNARRAAAFARRLGVSYPLVSDTSGAVAARFQIPDLPFTVIVSPGGYLEALHPGTLTTEQLEYVVENLDPALRSS
jgi:cytochrome oxidase Cu insertion factor (SCO1/SenC/PrrC family)/thiol-disulfide isomerase/thioredoxin